MISWFIRNPLLHGLILFLTIPAAFLTIIVFLIYDLLILFNPNYEEFGPNVSLYKTQGCVDINKPVYINKECFLAIGHEGMWKNNPQTLAKVVEDVANQNDFIHHPNLTQTFQLIFFPKPLPALIGYPKAGNQWICSKNGEIIPDNTTERVQAIVYKCWPK